jgi:hypothetical protein
MKPPYETALQAAHDAVNSLGGVAVTADDMEYCRALDEVLWAIEASQATHNLKKVEAQLESLLAQTRRPRNGFPEDIDK